MNAVVGLERRPSVCPHDCPSVCALDVEVIDGERIGRVRGAPEQTYTAGVVCAKVARYAERIHHPDRLTQPLRRIGPKGSGQFAPIGWDEALDRVAENFLAGRAPLRRRERLALFLRRHDGSRDARRHRAPHPRQALFALLRHDLRRHRLAGLCRGNRAADRRRSARNGEVRLRRDLGHQRRRHPGQRDDPRHARAQRPRRQNRRHRHLRHRDDAPGRSRAAR